MKFVRTLLALSGIFATAIVTGIVVSSLYGNQMYPQVSVEERDVYFDIGLVFLASVAAVLLLAATIAWVRHRNTGRSE